KRNKEKEIDCCPMHTPAPGQVAPGMGLDGLEWVSAWVLLFSQNDCAFLCTSTMLAHRRFGPGTMGTRFYI
ncbi:hypothetical protein NPIL_307961, partial [Nephila pilipes]